jgi:hypothetical protein
MASTASGSVVQAGHVVGARRAPDRDGDVVVGQRRAVRRPVQAVHGRGERRRPLLDAGRDVDPLGHVVQHV